MSVIDTKNPNWYNSPTEEEKKRLAPVLVIVVVKNNVPDIEEHYLEFTNEIVNAHSIH